MEIHVWSQTVFHADKTSEVREVFETLWEVFSLHPQNIFAYQMEAAHQVLWRDPLRDQFIQDLEDVIHNIGHIQTDCSLCEYTHHQTKRW